MSPVSGLKDNQLVLSTIQTRKSASGHECISKWKREEAANASSTEAAESTDAVLYAKVKVYAFAKSRAKASPWT